MAISSFDKNFVLDSERAIKSFESILSTEPVPLVVDRSRTSPEAMKKGEDKLVELLSQYNN